MHYMRRKIDNPSTEPVIFHDYFQLFDTVIFLNSVI